MSDFHEGRVAATFSMGSRLENAKEVYEEEVKQFNAMKTAFGMAGARLEEYRGKIKEDVTTGKLPLKEGEHALSYVSACIELVKQLFTDTEARRLASHGAAEAMKKAVADAKAVWDSERAKLAEVAQYESQVPQNLKERPVGYLPEDHPLEAERVEEEQAAPSKKQRKTRPQK
jgi:hypothetical protein